MSRGLARYQPAKGIYYSPRPSKLSPEFVASTRPMNRARKLTRAPLHCSAKSESQPEPSLLHDLTQVSGHPFLHLMPATAFAMTPKTTVRWHHLRYCSQGLRMSYEMLDFKTKAVALQNSSLLVERRQDAAYIKELRDAHAELTATVAKQAANVAAPKDCQSSTHNSLAQVSCCLRRSCAQNILSLCR